MPDKDKAPDSVPVDQSAPPTEPPLLADAIRSHLELKKVHGADPREIEDERQALEDEPSLEFDWNSQRKVDESETDLTDNGDLERTLQADAMPPAQPGSPVAAAPTQQLASTQQPASPNPAIQTDHDVLEDIPDFFEQTPEYDRMWFEEKSPREFDFFKR